MERIPASMSEVVSVWFDGRCFIGLILVVLLLLLKLIAADHFQLRLAWPFHCPLRSFVRRESEYIYVVGWLLGPAQQRWPCFTAVLPSVNPFVCESIADVLRSSLSHWSYWASIAPWWVSSHTHPRGRYHYSDHQARKHQWARSDHSITSCNGKGGSRWFSLSFFRPSDIYNCHYREGSSRDS